MNFLTTLAAGSLLVLTANSVLAADTEMVFHCATPAGPVEIQVFDNQTNGPDPLVGILGNVAVMTPLNKTNFVTANVLVKGEYVWSIDAKGKAEFQNRKTQSNYDCQLLQRRTLTR